MHSDIEVLMRQLERNNIKPYYVDAQSSVVPLISQMLKDGDTVTVGGSTSLFEAGVIEFLSEGPYHFLNRYEAGLSEKEVQEIYADSIKADAYLCSCNAVTMAGELYNVDGNSNRIGAIAYGPRSVIMVVGINKIVKDLGAAVQRVKTAVAPKIFMRSGRDTPCSKTGHCISQAEDATSMTMGCDSPQRVCCNSLITGRQRHPGRIKVILVREALGL